MQGAHGYRRQLKRGRQQWRSLSQFCNIQIFPNGHYNYYRSFVGNWLNGTGTTNQGTASPNAVRSG